MSRLNVAGCPNNTLAFTNRVYVGKAKFSELYVGSSHKLNEADPNLNIYVTNPTNNATFVFMASPFEGMASTDIGLNLQQRKGGMFTVGQAVNIEVFHPSAEVAVNTMTVSVDLLVKKQGNKGTVDSTELATFFKHFYSTQVFRAGQTLAVDFNGQKLELGIVSFEHADIHGTGAKKGPFGQLLPVSELVFQRAPGTINEIILTGGAAPKRNDA
eukprot:gene31490-38059_t